MNCECSEYEPIELDRKSIRKRINETKTLKKLLEFVAEYQKENTGHKLLRCAECGQFWQASRAWNVGAEEYLFKVPVVSVEDWLAEPYMKPDDLMMCGIGNQEVLSQDFLATDRLCKKEACDNRAIQYHILCKEHYLQEYLKFPEGRIFLPYRID